MRAFALILIAAGVGCSAKGYEKTRETLSLNGRWQVAQGALDDSVPAVFPATVPVPGLMNSAAPPFLEVGESSPRRAAFWYQREFDAPPPAQLVRLVIKKAKYGIKVWMNGEVVGEHLGSYTRAEFDVTDALVPGTNVVTVRVGAYRDAVPAWVPAAQDSEKERFLPGLYDDVELQSTGAARIVRTKIETDIDTNEITVRTTLVNDSGEPRSVTLDTSIVEWVSRDEVSKNDRVRITMDAGDTETVEQVFGIDGATRWSPEEPFLYQTLQTLRYKGEGADDLTTRFGVRKVEWRSAPDYGGRFYLNDELYYLRGSNITLHRFFEDTLLGTLPWTEEWVRALLSVHPKALHWNHLRFSLGRAPDFWYDLADEIGLLIADEFQMWTLTDASARDWDPVEMEAQFTSWMQDNWNHPAIAWWDACNETSDSLCTDTVAAVRGLDETRAWENGGYNEPGGPADPIEDHPYLFGPFANNATVLARLDPNEGIPPQGGLPGTAAGTWDDPTHPYINNEYAWLWIDRQGQPTSLSQGIYDTILGPGPHAPEVYREAYGYLTGGLTEFWRARRRYAGVMHFTYLGYSRPGGATSDNFVNVERLVLESRWQDYATSAFAPLMVYIDSWRSTYPAGSTEAIPLVVINDLPEAQSGRLLLRAVGPGGELAAAAPVALSVDAFGRTALTVDLTIPADPRWTLLVELTPDNQLLPAVRSQRKVGFAHPGESL